MQLKSIRISFLRKFGKLQNRKPRKRQRRSTQWLSDSLFLFVFKHMLHVVTLYLQPNFYCRFGKSRSDPQCDELQTGVLNPLRCKLGFGDISAITKPSTTSPYFTDYLLFQNAGLPDNNYQPKHTFRAENRKPMGKKALCFKNKVKKF